jgi:outer membrane murein-binding lipoprotein Lpp
MRSIVMLPLYALIAGGFLVSGCVVETAHDHDRDRARDTDYRQHQREEAYRHCRDAGERDCDDLLRDHDHN